MGRHLDCWNCCFWRSHDGSERVVGSVYDTAELLTSVCRHPDECGPLAGIDARRPVDVGTQRRLLECASI
jgi:hypothetical protein